MLRVLCPLGYSLGMLACSFWLSACVIADDRAELSDGSTAYQSEVLDQLEARVDSVGKETLTRMVPTLIKLLERQEPTLDWRVLRLLPRANLSAVSDSQLLVESVSRLLDAPEQATRALAVDVMCAIGEPGISASLARLESASPRIRACSATVLARQGRLSEADAIKTCRDRDPRVRAATIAALGTSKDGVKALIAMLADQESAVACRAADQLARLTDKPESETIVHALTNALTREDVSFFAAVSLARMGSDARSAIPGLLAVRPVGRTRMGFYRDMVEVALARIGEPREEDFAEIVRLIESGDVETRILACQALSRAGKKAANASATLERMMRVDLARDKQQELKPDSERHERYVIAADAALSAFWFVTRDARGFRSLAEEWPGRLWLGSGFWSLLDENEKLELISFCLESSRDTVVAAALTAIAGSSPMPSLEGKLQTLIRAQTFEDQELLAIAWLNTLAAEQPQVEDRLLTALDRRFVSVEQFARVAYRLNCGNARSLRILLEGARTLNKYPAQRCGEAYLQLAGNRIEAIRTVAPLSRLGSEWLAAIIAKHKWDSPELIRFATNAMRNSESSTQLAGVRILGNIGQPALKTVPEIRALLDEASQVDKHQTSGIPLACAVAIFKITGDSLYIDKHLQQIAEQEAKDPADAVHNDYQRQQGLQDIIVPDSKYTDLVVERLNTYDPLSAREVSRIDMVDRWIRLALRTEDPQARACVIRFANSKDVLIAKVAQERLRDGN